MSNPENIQTIPSNGTSTKRKSPARKASTAAPKTRGAKTSAPAEVEILFTQAPDPYREPVAPFIWIDHPQDGERLGGPVYVIRLGVGGAEAVELSIDKKAWTPCRLTSGYYWYDWAAIAPGKHTLVARMRTADGRWFRTPPVRVEYKS